MSGLSVSSRLQSDPRLSAWGEAAIRELRQSFPEIGKNRARMPRERLGLAAGSDQKTVVLLDPADQVSLWNA